ncbi:MAG: hypothetical protein AAGG02_05560 [Cyanobacteria bacterium P01_H01_bin.15]
MVVILTKNQILSVEPVCKGCLLADRQGTPRFREGKLTCAQDLNPLEAPSRLSLYRCHMGFKLAVLDT